MLLEKHKEKIEFLELNKNSMSLEDEQNIDKYKEAIEKLKSELTNLQVKSLIANS